MPSGNATGGAFGGGGGKGAFGGRGGYRSGGGLGKGFGGSSGYGRGAAYGGKAAAAPKSANLASQGLGHVYGALFDQGLDVNDEGNSFGQNLGNLAASMFGFNESFDPQAAALGQRQASWGFDPAGLIGGMAGGAFGIPATGMLADFFSRQLGRPMEIGLGPSVFGGPTQGNQGQVASAGPAGGQASPLGGPGGDWRAQLARAASGMGQPAQSPMGLSAGFPGAAPLASPGGMPGGGLLAGYQLSGPLAQRFGPGAVSPFRYG